MRIEINRDECPERPVQVSDCIRCVERYLTAPLAYERHCFKVSEQRHVNDVTVIVCGENEEPVVLTDDEIWPYVHVHE
jgi:hypothetical protein